MGLRGLASLLVLLAGCQRPPTPQIRRTNVLWIVIDTLRADRLGTFGYDVPTSPVIDELAARSVVFEQFYANAPWTRPSVATMLTGLYPRTTGVYEERFDTLPDELVTVAERFRGRGYTTIGHTANPNLNANYGFDQGFVYYRNSGQPWPFSSAAATRDMEPGSVVTSRTLEAFDQLGEDDAPWFMLLVYIDPHAPYAPPDTARDVVAAGGSSSPDYDGEVREVDTQLGELLAGMKQRGLLEDTLVVLCADHGEGLDSHPELPDSRQHGPYLVDEVVHVPLILHHPGISPRRVTGLASMVDLVPTVMELLNDPLPDTQVEGSSRAGLVRGEAGGAEQVILETDWRVYHKLGLRTGSHKLVRNDDVVDFARGVHEGRKLRAKYERALSRGTPVELYPARSPEKRGASLHEAEPALVDSMGAALRAWESHTPRRPPLNRDVDDVTTTPDGLLPAEGIVGEPERDDVMRRQLQALGYTE